MNKKLQNQQAVLSPANADRRVSTAHKTMPLAKAVWANVFILFLLLGFWRTGGAQTFFIPGPPPAVLGSPPVAINTVVPTAELHVDGQVRFENLNTSTGIQQYLTWQPSGDLAWQTGIAPLPGGNLRETLFWNGIEWQNTDFLTTTPGVGIGIDLPPGGSPLSKLHLDDNSGIGNYALWTNSSTLLGGARIGQQTGTSVFQIIQDEPADMEFLAGGANVAYMNNINGGFFGVGTPGPLTPGTLTSGGPIGGGSWITTPPPFPAATPVFSTVGDISTPANIYSNNIYIASDARLKENITQLPDWKRIFEIQSYTYKYIGQKHEGFSYGFLAQDVNRTLPELTSLWGEALSVNYIGFIPFLAEGLKEHEERLNTIEQQKEANPEIEELKVENRELKAENKELRADLDAEIAKNEQQDKKIEQQDEKIKALEDLVYQYMKNNAPSTENTFEQTGTLNQPASLEQNEPNPVTQETVIHFFVPEGAKNARIEVKNMEGKVVGSFVAQSNGHGSLTLKAASLAAGTYYYSLIIGDKTVDTKSMILLN